MANPAFIKNIYLSDQNPSDMSEEIALSNGKNFYEYLSKYLNNEFTPVGVVAAGKIAFNGEFKPTDVVPEDLKVRILAYFNTDERKKWLARQLYLLTGVNQVKNFSEDSGDDTLSLLNWLFNRNGTKHDVMSGPSPLSVDLKMPVAGGARRRRRTRTQKKRSRRSRKHRR
jgi:hypothetical protein